MRDATGTILGIVPIDRQGNVPEELALVRLHQIEEGDRDGKPRVPTVDLAIQAKRVATKGDRLAQYLWWIYPNEADFANVDTTDAAWAPPAHLREKGYGMAILAKDKAQREAVLEVLRRNFTARERRLMRGLLIEVKRPRAKGAAGVFQQAKQGPVVFERIQVDPLFLSRQPDARGPNAGEKVDQDVLTHELVHFLRRRDPGRRGTLGQRPRPFFTSGSDRDLEEAMTDAETLARVRQAPTGRRGGYHQHIKKEGKLKAGLPADAAHDSLLVHDKQVLAGITAPRTLQEKRGSAKHYPFELAREIDIERGKQAPTLPGTTKQATTAERVENSISFDTASQRDKVVARMFKGRSGRAADKTVQEHFLKLALAHLQLNGKAEAVDTYWRYRRKHATLGDLTVETHLYSPSANLDRREAIDNIVTAGMSKGNAGVAEWRDGKLVQLSSKRKAGGSGGKADVGSVSVRVPTQRQLDRATAGGW